MSLKVFDFPRSSEKAFLVRDQPN